LIVCRVAVAARPGHDGRQGRSTYVESAPRFVCRVFGRRTGIHFA
jgi:hypothetical protein